VFVREPHAMVVSGALYHKKTSEEWTHIPLADTTSGHNPSDILQDTHARMVDAARCGLLEGSPPRANETLQQYMRRAPQRDGLLFEAVRALRDSASAMREATLAAIEEARRGRARIALACLEWASEKEGCYTTMWAAAAEHLTSGMREEAQRTRAAQVLRTQAAKHSGSAPSHAAEREKHSTNADDALQLLQELRELDGSSPVLRGALARLEAEMPCGSPPGGGSCAAVAGELLSGESLLRWWDGASARQRAAGVGSPADWPGGEGDNMLLPPMPYC
jgi:hypothetical protein